MDSTCVFYRENIHFLIFTVFSPFVFDIIQILFFSIVSAKDFEFIHFVKQLCFTINFESIEERPTIRIAFSNLKKFCAQSFSLIVIMNI